MHQFESVLRVRDVMNPEDNGAVCTGEPNMWSRSELFRRNTPTSTDSPTWEDCLLSFGSKGVGHMGVYREITTEPLVKTAIVVLISLVKLILIGTHSEHHWLCCTTQNKHKWQHEYLNQLMTFHCQKKKGSDLTCWMMKRRCHYPLTAAAHQLSIASKIIYSRIFLFIVPKSTASNIDFQNHIGHV